MSRRICSSGLVAAVATFAIACAPRARADASPPSPSAEPALGWFQSPALHGDTLVFAAEGDLWTVPLAGGTASRLTTHHGQERDPAISPDGRWLAYTATYEGAREVHVMPLAGGPPTQLTWYGERERTRVRGWTPDGRILVATTRYATLPDHQLVLVDPRSPEGGHAPESRVPLAEATDAAVTADGKGLYVVRKRWQGSATKRYRGGTAQKLWFWPGGKAEVECLTPDHAGTSRSPRRWRDRLLFVSDRDGTMELWSMALGPDGRPSEDRDLRQHTTHARFDVQAPSVHGDRVAFQLGGGIRVLDLGRGEEREVPIRLRSTFEQTRGRWLDAPAKWLSGASLGPSGEKVALVARGQVWVVPVDGEGRRVEATGGRTAGTRWREAVMLGGGDVLAFGDRTDELELHSLDPWGERGPEQASSLGRGYRRGLVAAPDGTRAAWQEGDLELRVQRLEPGDRPASKVVHTGAMGVPTGAAWAPDSRHLAYVVEGTNGMGRLWLADTDREGQAARLPVTSARTDSWSPAFSADGRWLFFLSDRKLKSLVPSPWGSRQPEPFLDASTGVYALSLTGAERSPMAAWDEVAVETGVKDADAEAADAAAAGEPVAYRLDRDTLRDALFELPIAPGNYSGLLATSDHLYVGTRGPDRTGPTTLVAYALTRDDEHEATTILDHVQAFELNADRTHLLVVRKPKGAAAAGVIVLPANGRPPEDLADARVDLSGWRLALDPATEWQAMFRDAWRMHRDWFYDPGMHGVDWEAMRARYEPLVARVTARHELDDLLAQMVGEVSALHTYVFGGELRKGAASVPIGRLGATFEAVPQGFRVVDVAAHDPDHPAARPPASEPAVRLAPGDVVTRVDGRGVAGTRSLEQHLRGKVGRPVRLGVLRGGEGDLEPVVVRPVDARADRGLRYTAWELERRARVEALGRGRVGYLHLRAMGGSDYAQFARDYYPVFDRDALVIDVRHNRGGNIDSWILARLLRRAWMAWQARAGEPFWNMPFAFQGPIVVLVDAWTASDGEAFAEGFRRLGLGKVLGVRTWGGEIWLSYSNRLVDRGIASAPQYGVYGPERAWLIEGHGVEPDRVVDNMPRATFDGADAQLDAAVAELLAELKANPPKRVRAPAYPDLAPAEPAPEPAPR